MTSREWHDFQELLAQRTGLLLRERDLKEVGDTLAGRWRALRLSRIEEYLSLLQSDTPLGVAEWKRLMPLVTNGESYFLRDTGQHDLLRACLLPELIERCRARRVLRVWSAGCSHGEEAYSLAILLDELLPAATRERDGWNVSVVGTDINEAAIEKARRGIYGAWSLRALSPAARVRYFQERSERCESSERAEHSVINGRHELFEIKPSLRAGVTFRIVNLCDGSFPDAAELTDFDLILCRNVLIYFARETVALVLSRLADSLNAGGYLLTGHAELHHQDLGSLHARLLPGSVVYQRSEHHDEHRHSKNAPPSPASIKPAPRTPTAKPMPAPAPAAPTPAAPTTPLTIAPAHARPDEIHETVLPCYAALCSEAASHANAGRHDDAVRCCREALALNENAPAPYLLLARIAEERDEASQARALLQKAIYLAPSCVTAYLELGALHWREGNKARARQMRTAALELLEAMPREGVIEGLEPSRAGDVARAVRELLVAR